MSSARGALLYCSRLCALSLASSSLLASSFASSDALRFVFLLPAIALRTRSAVKPTALPMVKFSIAPSPKSASGLYMPRSIKSWLAEATTSWSPSTPPDASALENLFIRAVLRSSVASTGRIPRNNLSTGANSLKPTSAPNNAALSSWSPVTSRPSSLACCTLCTASPTP